MHYSGILVVTDPERIDACAAQIEELTGVEVRHRYPEQGRMILVQENESIEDQEQGLRTIRAIPEVQVAALVGTFRMEGEAECPLRPEENR